MTQQKNSLLQLCFSFVLCVPTHIHFSFCLVLFHIFQFSHPMCSFCISHVSITCYLFHLSVYFFICHAYVFEFVCLLFIVSCVLAFPAVFLFIVCLNNVNPPSTSRRGTTWIHIVGCWPAPYYVNPPSAWLRGKLAFT